MPAAGDSGSRKPTQEFNSTAQAMVAPAAGRSSRHRYFHWTLGFKEIKHAYAFNLLLEYINHLGIKEETSW